MHNLQQSRIFQYGFACKFQKYCLCMLAGKILLRIFILRRFFRTKFSRLFHVFLFASKDDPIFAKKQTQSLDYLLQWDAAIIKVKLYLTERRYSARIEANKQFHCNRWCKTGKLRQRKSSTDWKEIEEALRKRNCKDLMHVGDIRDTCRHKGRFDADFCMSKIVWRKAGRRVSF